MQSTKHSVARLILKETKAILTGICICAKMVFLNLKFIIDHMNFMQIGWSCLYPVAGSEDGHGQLQP